MILVCHASPGSQTAGFDQDLDAEHRHRARLAHGRPGHRLRPHPPARDPRPRLEADRQRRLAGYVFDGDPTASWALRRHRRRRGHGRDPADRVRRAGGRQRDLGARPAGRRLPGGHRPHREAGPMTRARPAGAARVVVTGMGAGHGARQRRRRRPGHGLVAGRSGIRTIEALRPVAARLAGSPARSATSTPAACSTARSMRRTDRYIQFGLVAARRGARPGRACRSGSRATLAERTGVILGTGLGGVGTLVDDVSRSTRARARTGSARSSSRWASRTSAAGQVAISFGPARAELRDRVACATGGHAIGEACEIDPARRRRRDARRRRGGRHLRGRSSAASPRCARSRPATTTRRARRARSTTAATASSSARAPASSSSRRSSTPRRAGREILAELVGYGATADASHITLPAPGGIGAVRAARRALEKAGHRPGEIDHVNAHATSTPEGDKAELQAIRTIFGDARAARSRSPPTSRCSATRSARPARSRRSRRS